MKANLLQMGRVGRPHGIKGELSIDWEGEYIPQSGDTIFLQSPEGTPTPYHIKSARHHKGKLLIFLDDILSRTDAENLKGKLVFIPRENLQTLKDGEAFIADLLGKEIYLENGERLGILDHVEFPANQIIWVIKDSQNKEILFPAIPEFIKNLGTEKQEIIISPPEGLLDIYRA